MLKRWLISRNYWSVLCCLAIAGVPIPALAETTDAPCEKTTPALTNPSSEVVDQLIDVAQWTSDPGVVLSQVVGYLGPQIETLWTPQVWPEIAEKARQAKVPVIMYHDILPEKQVFFDVTPAEFEAHLQRIQMGGLSPISLDQLVNHLQTGASLPPKPILLTFDDGYQGHFKYVLPLLRKYGYPGTFSIYTKKIGQTAGRPGITLDELKIMAADRLVTISAHSVSHPQDLRKLTDEELRKEIFESREILENQLKIPIQFFTYPAGFYDERVSKMVAEAGFKGAMTMDETEQNEKFANESSNLLTIERFGQSNLDKVLDKAFGGTPFGQWASGFNFQQPIALNPQTIDGVKLVLISGGKPITIHAKTRDQVENIIKDTPAIAAVDGGFFSLEFLDSNVMIGPVFSRLTNKFVPGNKSENPRLNGRPLVLISDKQVKFIPFDAQKHNSLEGIQTELSDVKDAFVGAAFLVRDGQPQPDATFGNLFDFNAERHRAFWGISQDGVPIIGVSADPVGSVHLGKLLVAAGFQDAMMLDSGASTSLALNGESLVGYTPRPVPHAVGLVPPPGTVASTNQCDAQNPKSTGL